MRKRTGTGGLALAIALVMSGSACSSVHSARPAHTGSSAVPATTSVPSPPLSTDPADAATSCGTPSEQVPQTTTIVRTADGVRLAAVEAGTGTRGVLLIPEVGGVGLCGWLDYASYLDQHGFRTLAFDHRCRQDSECGATSTNELMVDILAGIKRLRADGATSVALVGASQGASEALIAGAGRVDSTVTAVVALSADELTVSLAGAPYAATAQQAAAAIQLPVLFAVAQDDSYVSVAETTNMYASAPSDFKRLVTLPTGAGHGWDMVTDLSSALSSTVVAFLTETAK